MPKATASSKRAIRKSDSLQWRKFLELRLVIGIDKKCYISDPWVCLDRIIEVLNEDIRYDAGANWVYAAEGLELDQETFDAAYKGLK